jgi:hypothetical protein
LYDIPYRYLGVINNPNAAGTSCGFTRDAIDLQRSGDPFHGSYLGLPFHNSSKEDSTYNSCAYIDTFNCKTLTFMLDSSRFCVPILLYADTAGFRHNGFYFCMTYDTTFVSPSTKYIRPTNNLDFTVTVDSLEKGKICISITNVNRITYTSHPGEINLGCMEFAVHNDPFNADTANYSDYLSFNIIDGCNNNLQIINAWLTDNLDYWATEDKKYWRLEY